VRTMSSGIRRRGVRTRGHSGVHMGQSCGLQTIRWCRHSGACNFASQLIDQQTNGQQASADEQLVLMHLIQP
jgi:hypothetical protein